MENLSRLKQERLRRGWSLTRVTMLTGISSSQLSLVERGLLVVHPGWQTRIAGAFEMAPEALFAVAERRVLPGNEAAQMGPFDALDEAIASASPADRAGLIVGLAGRLAALGAGMAVNMATAPVGDEHISVESAAAKLGVSPAWIYRNRPTFLVSIGRRRLASVRALETYMRNLQETRG